LEERREWYRILIAGWKERKMKVVFFVCFIDKKRG